jgi:hypothetical protein
VTFEVLERVTHRGAVVVNLFDGFTDEPVRLPVKVTVRRRTAEEEKRRPEIRVRFAGAKAVDPAFEARNAGKYGFTGLAAGTYEISVVPNYYVGVGESPFRYDGAAGSSLLVKRVLKPSPAYPFPPGATLVRGVVKDKDGAPVRGARVSVDAQAVVETATDAKGEFVLFFKKLKYEGEGKPDNDLVKVDGVYYVIAKGGSASEIELTLSAKKEAVGTGEATVKVAVAKTTLLDVEGKKITLTLKP